jgi:predicted ATP-binding protein involved in virulence
MKRKENLSLAAKVAAFKSAIEEQTATMKSLLTEIMTVGGVRKTSTTAGKIATKAGKKTHTEVIKKDNNGMILIEALRKIGRPSTTAEIAKRMKKFNPTFSNLAKNKKQFMQLIYTNASQLSRDGIIVRRPISDRIFEYSLKEWDKTSGKDKDAA